MLSQILNPNPTIDAQVIDWKEYLEAAKRLIENPKGKENGWSYESLRRVIIFLLTNAHLDFGFELEKADLREIVEAIESRPEIVQKTEEGLQAYVPTPYLEELERELQAHKEATTSLAKRKAAHSLFKTAEKDLAFRKLVGRPSSPYKEAQERYQGQVADFGQESSLEMRESLGKANERQIIAEVLTDKIGPEEIKLASQKLADFPPEIRTTQENEINDNLKANLGEMTLEIVEELKKEGIEVSPLEMKVLARIKVIPNETLPQEAIALKSALANWFVNQITPLETDKAEKIASIIAPAIACQLPEISSRDLAKLPPGELTRIQEKIQEATIVALAETAPQLSLSPREVPRIINAFVPQTREDLNKLGQLLATPKEERIINLSSPSSSPIAVAELEPQNPSLLANSFKQAIGGNIWKTENDEGKRVVDELRQQIYQEGINDQNAFQLRDKVLESWALKLTVQGYAPEDIDFTIEKVKESGVSANSFRILELKEIQESLTAFQKGLPSAFKQEAAKVGLREGLYGYRLIRLGSPLGTTVIRKIEPKINPFLNRLFGERVFVNQGQIFLINNFSFFNQKLVEGLKTSFFKTTFGQTVKAGLQKLGQESLQAVWSAAKTGLQASITKGITTVLVSLGLQAVATAVAPIIGNILVAAASFIGTKILGRARRQIPRDLKRARDFLFNFDVISDEEKSPGLLLLVLVLGVFLGVGLLSFIIILPSGAFVTGLGGSSGAEPIESSLECSKTTDFAEKVICFITSCATDEINIISWPDVAGCLDDLVKHFFDKDILALKAAFDGSVHCGVCEGKLQCVGFAMGIQAALGRPFNTSRNACSYVNNPPSPQYERIGGSLDKNGNCPALAGDLAVWDDSPCGVEPHYGHIGVVVQVSGNRISVAEANGNTGKIDSLIYSCGTPGDGSSPTVFYRWR